MRTYDMNFKHEATKLAKEIGSTRAACQRFEFVSLYADEYSISDMCRILDVSRKGIFNHYTA